MMNLEHAKNSNIDASTKNDFEVYIRRLAFHFYRRCERAIAVEDIVAYGYLGMYSALNSDKYLQDDNEERQGCFVRKYIRYTMLNGINKMRGFNRRYRGVFVEVEASFTIDALSEKIHRYEILRSENDCVTDMRIDFERFSDLLSDNDRLIVNQCRECGDYLKVAEVLNINYTSLYRKLYRIHKKFKAFFTADKYFVA